jgi:hypothetical protein
MPRYPGPRKDVPLTAYLAALSVDEVTLTLGEVEQIIGTSLPASARQASFWGNRRRGLSDDRPWVQAGWWMVRTALHARPPAVHFARVVPDSPHSLIVARRPRSDVSGGDHRRGGRPLGDR